MPNVLPDGIVIAGSVMPMLGSEEAMVILISDSAFEGWPAASSTWTTIMPVAPDSVRTWAGAKLTLRDRGVPLGSTVTTVCDAELKPDDIAVMSA
jgi:hypothetical protein